MRAQMRVRITMPSKDGKRIKTQVLALVDKVEDDEWADEWELVSAPSFAYRFRTNMLTSLSTLCRSA